MTDAKSAAERLLESREFCTGWPHPTTNPVRYMFATADVFAVANRCLELEMEVNKLNTECGHLAADKAELEAENAKLRAVFTWVTADVAREWAEGTWVLMRHKDSVNISLSQWHRPDWAATHFRDVLFVNIDTLKPEEALKGR